MLTQPPRGLVGTVLAKGWHRPDGPNSLPLPLAILGPQVTKQSCDSGINTANTQVLPGYRVKANNAEYPSETPGQETYPEGGSLKKEKSEHKSQPSPKSLTS